MQAHPNRVIAVPLLLLLAPGCSPLYVLRAGYEEAKILLRRQPIERVLKQPLPDGEREKLELVLAVRDFARRRLGLAVGGSYTSVARVDSGQVVHVVTAAPWDRLEPVTWWFPIVGRLPYRGYFDLKDARAFAKKLEGKGYDTWVRPSVAFSTLGWFDDPLLSNLLRYDRASLANIIIHELLHNTLYLKGQGAFNESFANFASARGAIEFLQEKGLHAEAEAAQARYEDVLRFSRFLGRWVRTLEAAYDSGITQAAREELFERMRRDFGSEPWRTDQFGEFRSMPINNAVLVHEWTYHRDLDGFQAVLASRGGELGETIRVIIESVENAPDGFAVLERLEPE